jgi:hypothetical protein
MSNENPFFLNFDVSDFMNKFGVSGMDNEYSKKLMENHQKNLDAFVKANKIVTDGYTNIARKQMQIFQDGISKMSEFSSEKTAEFTQDAFKESTVQMQDLVNMATQAHQDAFAILSDRAKDMMQDTKD